MKTWVSVAVSMLAIYLAINEGRWQAAQRRGEQLRFGTGVFTRVAYFVGVLVCVAGVVLPSSDWVVSSGDWLTTAVFLSLIGLALLSWPRVIVLDQWGITEVCWGGLHHRKAAWSNVMHAIRVESDSELEVRLILRRGKAITHTKQHVDRDRFIEEVGKHVEVLGGPPRIM